jgi:integrase
VHNTNFKKWKLHYLELNKMAGEKRRSLQGLHIPTQREIIDAINNAPEEKASLRDKAFVAILYITAARIREIIPYEFAGFRTRKRKIQNPDGSTKTEKVKYWFERHWKGLTKRQIKPETATGKDGKELQIVLFENIPTEKRRGHLFYNEREKRWEEKQNVIWRTFPINVADDGELLDIIERYLDMVPNQDAPLFKFYRSTGRKIIVKIDPEWFPHLMRHARLTHLAVKKDWQDMELKKYTAWKDTRPAETYVHMQWQDIVKKRF